jgi:hypothetical protein
MLALPDPDGEQEEVRPGHHKYNSDWRAYNSLARCVRWTLSSNSCIVLPHPRPWKVLVKSHDWLGTGQMVETHLDLV